MPSEALLVGRATKMRPCRNCDHALTNDLNVCPMCGHAQDKPYRAPEPTIPEPQESDTHEALASLLGKLLVIGLPVLACRLAFGEQGWVIGFAVGIGLLFMCRVLIRG